MSTLDIAAASEYFVFDGKPSYEFKCLVFPQDLDSTPVKSYTVQSVPGRLGDVLLPDQRFDNATNTYDCIIYDDFDYYYSELRDFLLSREGYCRLSDTIHPDEFYHAYFSDSITPTITRDRKMGKFTLIFNRKPQRWLVSGEQEITVRSSGSWVSNGEITNPTRCKSYPLLYFYGSYLTSGFNVLMSNTAASAATTDTSTGIKLNAITPAGYTIINTLGLYVDMETLEAYNSQKRGTTTTSSLISYRRFITYTIGSKCKTPYMLGGGKNTFIDPTITNQNPMGYATEMKVIPRWFRL